MARGVSSDTKVGDKEAHLNCHAGVRLVRNILSATENSRLLLNSIVWGHVAFQTFEFGPPLREDIPPSLRVWAGRGRFMVQMKETAPTFTGETLELIRIDISDEGGVVLSREFT